MNAFVDYIEIDGVAYENQIVPRNYKLNPVEDELLYTDDLVDGMRVLIAEPKSRYSEDQRELYNAGLPVANRWCTVSKLRVEAESVFFIGVYDDGNKERRAAIPVTTWLVKKNSIPARSVSEDPFLPQE